VHDIVINRYIKRYWRLLADESLNKAATVSLPKSLLDLIEEVRRERRDPTRSDTVRVLLLQALASMSFLSESEKKALGMTLQPYGGDRR